ncbi:TrmH family RNA methyltransferase [Faecalibacterium prausnitzii]|uniref:TrmH family RNA methyltransferase n=1 Tax=Faecalibacterium prausnitzii TaxID=853 RepID=UPI003C2C0EBD
MPNIVEITDFHAPELDPYARLTQNQLRCRLEPEKGIFIAESPKVISRALDAGYEPVSLLMERRQITGPAAEILTRCGDAPVYTADRELLAGLTGFELTRGVLCAFRRPAPRSAEELCKAARRVAVLEGIVDSTNVGAIFRSAAALNMDAVLVTPSCCDPLCRRAVRVSMGTVFQVPWAQLGETPADWPGQGLARLRAMGFKTAAMALSDRSVPIDDEALAAEPKLAIVLGTEGDGLAHSTIAACDYTVKIPMSHGVDSLNVAAASAVAFWQLGR